ncbi:LAME_0C04236g1_1 [Lachancea meyersii CBS 8951]|uniref:LAME_0C04236g1_1 n=1 Tax=Lachancea meyersii CBS 8951 TaxID=1266667 RepID=A0A1G4J1C6_9SACH|nr:LAME_0C04236g1_1 [Lachancea meyersii CBS 8951]
MLSKLRLFICALTTIAVVFQVLPVISMPLVTSIHLSRYNGRLFGVFGWCTVSTGVCTPPRIGYSMQCATAGTSSADVMADSGCDSKDFAGDFLPSRAKRAISKLLVVHPMSLFFAATLWLMTVALNTQKFARSRRALVCAVLWSLPTVFLSLLSFLVDVLLFIPFLAWPGWLLLVSTVLIAVASCIMCGVRRSVSLQKYERLRNKDVIEFFPMQSDKLQSEESQTQQELPLERPDRVHRPG